jgi:hypothetical protein
VQLFNLKILVGCHRLQGINIDYFEKLSVLRKAVKPLVPAALAVVSTHQPALGPHGGLWPVLLMCNP